MDPAPVDRERSAPGTLICQALGCWVPILSVPTPKPNHGLREAGFSSQSTIFAAGNVATAGGYFTSQYLAAWIIARTEGKKLQSGLATSRQWARSKSTSNGPWGTVETRKGLLALSCSCESKTKPIAREAHPPQSALGSTF